jgi:nitroreductase
MIISFITLPSPPTGDPGSLGISTACSFPVSSYTEEQLAGEHIGELLWAAYAVSNARKKSHANRSNWLIFYVCWADAVWRYHPQGHCLTRHLNSDVRRELADAVWNRWFIAQAPCVFVITTVPKRGRRERCGEQWQLWYPSVEAGRAAERMLLQSTVLGLAGVVVSEFEGAEVKRHLILSRQEEPMCLVPVGWCDQG